MQYTELDLAQLERRILAAERCVSRQRQLLNHRLAADQPVEGSLQLLADFQARLSGLRSMREHVRAQIASATTQQLMATFWSLPHAQRRSLAMS